MPPRRSVLLTFQRLQREMDPELKATARNEQFRYLDYLSVEEVYAWMMEELWNAIKTFDPRRGKTIKEYWWSCYLNRRKKLIKHRYTETYRANREGLVGDEVLTVVGVSYQDERIPDCPVPGLLEWRVWRMLAVATARSDYELRSVFADICDTLAITPGLLAEIVESFRNSMVRRYLSGGM